MAYLDNNATTFIAPEVLKAMHGIYARSFANPSSPHFYGREGRHLLQSSLQKIASHFKVKENELVITSGATEALNYLIHGFTKKGHIITSQLEHMAVLEPIARKEREGWNVTYLTPEKGEGTISCKQIQESLRPDTSLIVLTAVNNETGVKTDLEAIARLVCVKKIFFLVDGVAWLGKEEVKLHQGISAVVFSGHKIHGPLGVGLAIVKKEFPVMPLIVGGPQQLGKRGGTENLPAIHGLAEALSSIEPTSFEKMKRLQHKLEEGICALYPKAYVHGKGHERVCNTSNICFPDIDGETLLIQLDLAGIAVSLGSACSSGGLEPSRVLIHMGVPTNLARSSLRFSISRYTTDEEIEKTIAVLKGLLL
jgi:cysteine desulfurase